MPEIQDDNILHFSTELHPNLIVLYPQKMFKHFPLKIGSQVLGRGQDADIKLEDELVSRKHCEIAFDGHNVTVTDLGSTNGTFVDGQQIQKLTLTDDNRLQVGCMVLKVEFDTHQGLFDLDHYESSTRDPLTKVSNFKVFTDRSLGEIALARLNDLFLHVATLKIGNLSKLQEAFGEQCSDLVLTEVARIIQEEIRNNDKIARLNENTFVLLISGIAPEDAQKYMEKVCSTIQHHRFSWKDLPLPVQLDLGLCSRQGQEVGTLQQMLADAGQ